MFSKETLYVIKTEVKRIKEQLISLLPTKISINDMEVSVKPTLIICMIDGKICNAVLDVNQHRPVTCVVPSLQQVIGCGGCVEWPPRSPDLNPLDFSLWGYIKQRLYATPPPTLQELRNSITDACASVSPAMLYNVQREVQSRVQMCIVVEGHYFEHDR
ncbi:hypothetical protein AVEN_10573-1 [Araneus ventricosus]|uniref:Tc1-like transposase DDE domain-containing protein n=1 Tax=Araneus ventricosus TaxID=182803 RepID=A0A4Y2NB92_ARAVE|nr:hypothetical protein AVEN_10573-1 [Araneus ventricosus]